MMKTKDLSLLLRNNIYRPRIYRGLKKEANIFISLSHLQKKIKCNILKLPNGIDNMKNFLGVNDLDKNE